MSGQLITGRFIIVDFSQKAGLIKRMNTCSNSECKIQGHRRASNFCEECGSKIETLDITVIVPMEGYLSSNLKASLSNISFERITYDRDSQNNLILINGAFKREKSNTVVNVEDTAHLGLKGAELPLYKEVLAILKSGDIKYSETTSSIAIF